jgi:hypothetical protein
MQNTINAHYTIYMNSPEKALKGNLQKAMGYCQDQVHSDHMALGTFKQEAGPHERWPKSL